MSRFRPYPLLLAAYPVLALTAQNVHQGFELREIVGPLGASLSLAIFAWLLAGFLTRDPDKRAALAAVVVLTVALSVPLTRGLGVVLPRWSWWLRQDHILVPGWLVVGVVLGVYSARSRRSFRTISRYLNLATAILVALSLVALVHGATRNPRRVSPYRGEVPRAAAADRRPDIYLIVLDQYTGSRSLALNYDFDNRPFEDALRRRGFVVPRASRTNYVHTALTLSALLNWNYLDDIANAVGVDSSDPSPLTFLIRDSRTWAFLESLGYRFVFFPTGFAVTGTNPHAHLRLPESLPARGEFTAVWVQETLIAPLLRWSCELIRCQRVAAITPESADLISWKFDQLARIPDLGAPRFVFAHLIVPHEPYLFHADCRRRIPYWPRGQSPEEEAKVKAAYVEQVRCVNHKVEQLVDALLAQATPPIILLQADHGHGRMARLLPLTEMPTDRVAERLDIFAAYYLPHGGASAVYDSISPVNVFRVVLDYYFGAGLPLLEDRSYWSESYRIYKFERLPPAASIPPAAPPPYPSPGSAARGTPPSPASR